MDLWRISKYPSLSGEGGLRFSARWHSAGRRIVYLAESPAGAMIEALVHLELNERTWPEYYDLLRIEAPDSIEIESLHMAGERWEKSLSITRKSGNEWLDSLRTPLARVSSAILPNTWNILLNPEHPDAQQIRMIEKTRARYGSRLFAGLRERE